MNHDQISNSELLALTKRIGELHHDQAEPAMRDAAAEWAELNRQTIAGDKTVASRRHSRRTFLIGTGAAVAGGAVLAACSSTPTASPPPTSAASARVSGDLQIVAMAASLENLAVATYAAGIRAAQQGRLGTVPPAVPVFAETVMGQHADHAKAWNGVLQAAGKKPVTGPDPVVKPTVDQAFAKVTDVSGLASLALELENTAAQTYQAGISAISSSAGIKTAASIQPVEMQHAAILYYVLGKYPGIQDASGNPVAFNPTSLARPPSDYQASG